MSGLVSLVGAGPEDPEFLTLKGARRIPQVVDRLMAMYASERVAGESARSFLRRLEPARASVLLADLASLTEDEALPDDSEICVKKTEFHK
jgi:siroheme synthase